MRALTRLSFVALSMGFLALGFWLAPPWPLVGQDKTGGPEIVRTFKGHTDAVYAVAISQDGKYVATGSFDNTIKLWEAATGTEVKTFGGPQGHQKMVLSVAFSNDGTMIASGSADNTLKVWDVPVSSPLRALAAADAVTAVALTADSTKLATGGHDGQVKIFNAADFKELFKLDGHQGPVRGVAFSANGQILASAGADKTLRFWNVANGQLIAAVGAHSGPVNAVLIHPNNAAAYSAGDDGLVKFWTLPPVPTKPLPAHSAPITAMFLSPDGNQVLTASADKTVRQTLTAGKELRTLTGPAAAVTSVTLNAAGNFVAAGTADNRVFLWNAADGKPVTQVLAHGSAVTGVSFHQQGTLLTAGADGLVKTWAMPPVPTRSLTHPDAALVCVPSADGKKLFTGSADKILRVWDLAKLTIERQYAGHTGPVSAVAVSANGQLLASGSDDGSIRFWSQATGKETDILQGHPGTVTALALNPAGTQLLSTGADGRVKLWQLPLAAPKALAHPDQVACLALSGDGNKIVTGGTDKIVRLWDIAKAAKERDFPGATLPITSVALGADGKLLAAGSADKTLHLWTTGDAKALHKITLPAVAQAVAVSPDGKTVAAGLSDNSIKLLEPLKGKELKALTGHKGAVTALAYSPKSDLLFSASADKTVQAWAVPDGAPKTKFEHTGPVTALALSRDGTRLAATADKTAKIWTVADGKEIGTVAAPAEIKSVGFSPDGARLVIGSADKLARVVELNGTLVESFAHDGAVNAAAFVDAKRVATGSADKFARVFTSALLWQQAHGGPVRRGLFTPKGDQIFTAGDDKTVKLWNAADGKNLKTITAHEGAVSGLALSTDGTRLITAGADKSVRVWNLAAKPGAPEETKPVAAFSPPAAAHNLALSPNGARLAVSVTEPQGSLIRVFDLNLGREVQVLAEHGGPVPSLAFFADNRTLATASQDKSARLLDVGVLTAFEAHTGGVLVAQYHSGGAQLLTAGNDKTVKIWDLAKNVVLKTFGPLPDRIKFAAYNRDFTQVGAAAGKVVKVWNVADGKDLLTLTHPADVLSLSFSVDKTKIATGSADKVTRVFDVATGKELQFFAQDDAVPSVIFMPQNNAVVSAGGKTPRVDTLSVARVIAADAGPVYGLAMTQTGTHVLSAGTDKTVKMWNIATGANERSFMGAGAALRSVAVSKNNLLVAAAGDDQAVRVYSLNDAKETGNVKAGAAVKALAFTPNNLALAAACADKSLQSWSVNFTAGQPLPADFLNTVQNFASPDVIYDLTIAADNATIYSGSAGKSVQVWKLASSVPTRNFPHPNHVDAVAFQPGGNLLVSGSHDGKVRIFDLVKNVLVKEINAHAVANATMIYTLAFTPDGKQVVSGSYDQSLKLWDVTSGNLVREFKAYKVKEFEKGHQDGVFSAAFSPDGKFLASGSSGLERVIKIWNVADGSVVRDLANPAIKSSPPASHPGWVYNLRYTKDGKRLVSVGDAPLNKGFLAVWDPAAGKMLYGETMPLGTFFGLAISPNDQFLAIGAGPRGRPTPNFNSAYLVKMPKLAN
jgi:WD40 repeat protein